MFGEFLFSPSPPFPVPYSSKPVGPETPDSTMNPNLLSSLEVSDQWEKLDDTPLHRNLPSQHPLIALVLAKVKRKWSQKNLGLNPSSTVTSLLPGSKQVAMRNKFTLASV